MKFICHTALLCSPDLPESTTTLFLVIAISDQPLLWAWSCSRRLLLALISPPELGSLVVAVAGPFLCRIPEQKGHIHGALKLGTKIPAGGYFSVWEVTE